MYNVGFVSVLFIAQKHKWSLKELLIFLIFFLLCSDFSNMSPRACQILQE